MDAQTLSLPISTLQLNQPCCVESGTPVSEAISLMQEGRYGCVLVVDRHEHLIGIITERDLMVHIMGKRLDAASVTVDEIMMSSPDTLRASDPIAFALNFMHLGRYRHVPLLVFDSDDNDENGYPVSVISSKDIAIHVAEFLEAD